VSEFPGRPDHPDFWLLSQVLIRQDAQAESGQPVTDMIARYLDPDSAAYMAGQRALVAVRRMARNPGTQRREVQLAAVWLDGLIAGMAVQHLKAQAAEDPA